MVLLVGSWSALHAQVAPSDISSTGTASGNDTAISEAERFAPIDYGPGPGQRRTPAPFRTAMRHATDIPAGSPDATIRGQFGDPVAWPVVPVHWALLPDGRVLSYGTDERGRQGALLEYDIWDPELGTGADAHLLLPNTTGSDIFCSGLSFLWTTGELLVSGGNINNRAAREVNYSRPDSNLFNPATSTLSPIAPMAYPRWYPSLVALPSGEMLVLGGRTAPKTPATVPELFDPATGWRTLDGAASPNAFGVLSEWFYPQAFVTPAGLVFLLGHNGHLFRLSTADAGSIRRYAVAAPPSNRALPSVMYAPGRILSVREDQQAVTIDINGTIPVVASTGSLSQERYWADATVMADGRVLLDGGSGVLNELTGVAYQTEIWDPATGLWSPGAGAAKPRLYHGNALLLPDGTVVTGGGGAPGPVVELNAEIYYPPYLYDASGQPAPRPSLTGVPSTIHIADGSFTAAVGDTDLITRITMVRAGAATHAINLDQRFLAPAFTQAGTAVTITLPSSPNILLPGYYMVFAFNAAGVPSLAAITLVSG